MRITAELIQKSSQYLNAVGEFHIDLRGRNSIMNFIFIGYKIPYIENLACTKDQFGTIDLTDNEITKVPALPPLKRLKTLLLSDNRIAVIENDFGKNWPGIENIVLMNNKVGLAVNLKNLIQQDELIIFDKNVIFIWWILLS